MPTPERQKAQQTLLEYLAEQGLRRTTQREAIVAAAMSTTEHFTAEDLLVMARGIDPSVSRATVYRTLPLLVRSGLLRELDFGGETKRYDPNFIEHPTHNHLICLDCGKILEFENLNIDLIANCVAKRLGYSPAEKTLKIEARCDNLARLGHCANRAAPA